MDQFNNQQHSLFNEDMMNTITNKMSQNNHSLNYNGISGMNPEQTYDKQNQLYYAQTPEIPNRHLYNSIGPSHTLFNRKNIQTLDQYETSFESDYDTSDEDSYSSESSDKKYSKHKKNKKKNNKRGVVVDKNLVSYAIIIALLFYLIYMNDKNTKILKNIKSNFLEMFEDN